MNLKDAQEKERARMAAQAGIGTFKREDFVGKEIKWNDKLYIVTAISEHTVHLCRQPGSGESSKAGQARFIDAWRKGEIIILEGNLQPQPQPPKGGSLVSHPDQRRLVWLELFKACLSGLAAEGSANWVAKDRVAWAAELTDCAMKEYSKRFA